VIVAAAPPAPRRRGALRRHPDRHGESHRPVASGWCKPREAGWKRHGVVPPGARAARQAAPVAEGSPAEAHPGGVSPESDHPLDLNELESAARSLQLQVQIVDARAPNELADALSAAATGRSGALVVLGGSMFFAHRARIAELAIRNRLPTVYLLADNVDAGGLMAYGPDLRDNFRRAAGYVDRILKGAKRAIFQSSSRRSSSWPST